MLSIYLSMLETEEEKKKLTDIYENYKHRYLHTALSILKNQPMAEDAVHNTFIELIKNKDRYFTMPCSDLILYTVSIVRTKCYDILRKEQKYVEFDESSDFDPRNEIEEMIMEKFDYEWAIGAIETLDDMSQDLLRKKYVLGHSYAQIAKDCGMTVKNVEVSLYRIRQKLRKMQKEETAENV
ncbi:MAG: sigma-70 family RNA polymerase sigma factor [Oscillospiraceae bacterium]|nr:sigma-70 family RNA polymerase sigma factor [Oscillospiraceae bacterium]